MIFHLPTFLNSIGIKSKATKISIQCRSCRTVVPNIEVRPGLEGYAMPRKCNVSAAGRPACPLDPYFIMPDKGVDHVISTGRRITNLLLNFE